MLNLTSVEVHKGNTKLDFICSMEDNEIYSIFCYINNQEVADWKQLSSFPDEQRRFIKRILEEYGMKETYIADYSQKIYSCLNLGIECILK